MAWTSLRRTDGSGSFLGDAMIPIGLAVMHHGSTPPGWLLCDGSQISRAAYAPLFDVIGTTYGEPFALPNWPGHIIYVGVPDIMSIIREIARS